MQTLAPQLAIEHITSSNAVVHTAHGSILFGCISEAIKYLDIQGHPTKGIRAIVLSDTSQAYGICNWALEFPLNRFLFKDNGFAQGKRLKLVGTKKQLARARQILELSLLGPSTEHYEAWDEAYPSHANRFKLVQRMQAFFALKDKAGNPLDIDELVDFSPYDRQRSINIDDLEITHKATDLFQLSSEKFDAPAEIHLDFTVKSEAPFNLHPLKSLSLERPLFGVTTLMHGNGFEPEAGGTSLIIWIDRKPYLWDAGAFVTDCLHSVGLNVQDLEGVIITHVHDDHASIAELMSQAHCLTLYATPEVYESLLLKHAAILDRDLSDPAEREVLEGFIHFKCLEVGIPISLGNAIFTPHQSFHSIPTIGGVIEYTRDGESRKFLMSGDHASIDLIDRASATKQFPNVWLSHARDLIEGDEDLVIYDGGGDPFGLHADPYHPALIEKFKEMDGRLVFGHRVAPTKIDSEPFRTIRPGDHFSLYDNDTEEDNRLEALKLAFSSFSFSDESELATLLEDSSIVRVPADTVICYKGDLSKEVYVIVEGQISVGETSNPNPIILTSGSLTAEMAALTSKPRSATLMTVSANKLLRIDAERFKDFVKRNNLFDTFQRVWACRASIMDVKGFRDLPIEVIHFITKSLIPIEYCEEDVLVAQGEISDDAYIVARGFIKVKRDGNIVANLKQGDIFGEKSALNGGRTPRTATVYAAAACKVLRLNGSVIRELNRRYLVVNQIIRLLLKERNLVGDITS